MRFFHAHRFCRTGLPLVLPLALATSVESQGPVVDSDTTNTVSWDSEGFDPSTSDDPVADARARQAQFERFRESRIPVRGDARAGGCDERIGRMCIWFGGEGEDDFPPEPAETVVARGELIRDLASTLEVAPDGWVIGQLVHYLVEAGNFVRAEQVARECGIEETWWCSALLGYALHIDRRFVEAEEAFREAASGVPDDEAERWQTPRFIVTPGAEETFTALDPPGRSLSWETLWRLSDPLFMVEGNDRLTEHYARLVVARNRETAAAPGRDVWGEDYEEALIRYGRTIGWSRVFGVTSAQGITGDPRQVWGHHHPRSRGYLFPEEFLEAPGDIPPESWITTPREARTWYAAPYAPDFRGLDTQVARFRRDEEMLVVAAYRPTPEERDPFAEAPGPPERRNPFGGGSSFGAPDPSLLGGAADAVDEEPPARSAFFLLPEAGGEPLVVEGADREGVFQMNAPQGRYVSSVEVFEEEAERAWRARQGVNQEPMVRGLVALSDLMILREDAPLPEEIGDAIPLARPGIRVGADERFTVAWEVYGLGINQEVEVTLGFTTGRPGFLSRIGEFLGIVEPEDPVEVTFQDAGGDRVETLFRAVALQLPDLAPGDYTLHLRLDLPGREPTISSRPIIVTP